MKLNVERISPITLAVVAIVAMMMGLAAADVDQIDQVSNDVPQTIDDIAIIDSEHDDETPNMPSSLGYDLTWHTIDGGGGTSSGGAPGNEFTLSGTIGQPDAGAMSGGQFELVGGFWAGGVSPGEPKCPIPADLNCDGAVDGLDLLVLLSQWGVCADPNECSADLNNDGSVDGLDLLILLSNWG